LDVLYYDMPSYQPDPAGNFMAAKEMRAALPSTEPITFPAKLICEMTVVFLTPPVLITTGLRVITSPISLTLVVESAFLGVVTSLTSVVAGVLVSTKTPPRLPVIPRPSPMNASATSSTIMIVKLVKVLSSRITRSSGVIEAEKEFVTKMVDSFYKSLKWSIALILKGSTTSFSTVKVVFSQNIESIQDFRGDDQVAALELLVEKFEKDVGEWRHLSSSDLDSLVDEDLERLMA